MRDVRCTLHPTTMPTAAEAEEHALKLGHDHFGDGTAFEWNYSLSPAAERSDGTILLWDMDLHCWVQR